MVLLINIVNSEGRAVWVGPGGVSCDARGCLDILNLPKAAVLNSRKPRRPLPFDEWIAVTDEMVRYAAGSGFAIVASLGANHWELPVYAALRAGAPLILVMDGPWPEPPTPELRGLMETGRVVFVSPFAQEGRPALKQRRLRRDELVVGLADSTMVGEISADGNMLRLSAAAMGRGARTAVFRPEKFSRRTSGNKALLDMGAEVWPGRHGPRLVASDSGQHRRYGESGRVTELDGPYLIHFTRCRPGPWPGQEPADYYGALLEGCAKAGHTAFDTLERILDEGVIRGSDRLTRGDEASVSLTACGLDGLKGLVKWRKALARWTVEPYGLALPRDTLFRLGARPAVYGSEATWAVLPASERYRFQLHDPPKTDWKVEREWRLAGDLDLRGPAADGLKVVVPTVGEAEEIARLFGLDTVLAGYMAQ